MSVSINGKSAWQLIIEFNLRGQKYQFWLYLDTCYILYISSRNNTELKYIFLAKRRWTRSVTQKQTMVLLIHEGHLLALILNKSTLEKACLDVELTVSSI